nr:unnamed protein product [Callosobruchus chinensis]
MASAKIIELTESNTCKICDNALAKYSCPKCNILYCSMSCYQSSTHLECSEAFYKDNVMSELNLSKHDEEAKAKMLDILQRTHENNRISFSDDAESLEGAECSFFDFINATEGSEEHDSDDDEVLDISDRLDGVNLDDSDQVWDILTEDERHAFVAFLKSDDVSKLVPSWQPWWLYHDNSMVEDLDKKNVYKENCPKICEDIKDFAQITTKQPAECVKYNLVNILCAYAFTAKFFYGDVEDFAAEAVAYIVTISLTLKRAQNFDNFDMAVKSVEQECINNDWIVCDSENLQGMREDLDLILRGPNKFDRNYYVLSALSDLHELMKKALEPSTETDDGAFSKIFPNSHFPSVKRETPENIAKNYIKKVEYYLSYSKYKFADHFLS